jgi:hypothetical protein
MTAIKSACAWVSGGSPMLSASAAAMTSSTVRQAVIVPVPAVP